MGRSFCSDRGIQGIGMGVDFPVFDGDHGVKGAEIVADAAGVDKPGLAPQIHHGKVGVAKEQQIQIFFLAFIARPQQRLLDAQGISATG